jgi:SAM-dependent methyltransferase
MSTTRTSNYDKVRKKHISNSRRKPYERVSVETINKFNLFKSQDATNLTPNYRTLKNCNPLLGLGKDELVNWILQRYEQTGQKVRLLDAGCGQAYAIDDLLSHPSLINILECVGVSLEYFTNVKAVMEKHGKRFKFVLGKVQDVIAKEGQNFDVIIDVAGAYIYSKERLQLVHQYYQALKPEGKAFVFAGSESVALNNSEASILAEAAKDYPNIFTMKRCNPGYTGYSTFHIHKTVQRCPLFHYKSNSYGELATIYSQGRSITALREGNAVCPSFEYPDQQSDRVLRPLPFK